MNNIDNYKRTIFSWSIYDFANQPFTTIILTFVYSTFFVDFIASTPESGSVLWGRVVSISSVFIAILSPVMGALADRGGYRKIFLIFWTWVCIIFSFLLYYPIHGDIFYSLLFFCIANIGFEMGGVFLNAYLPSIAPKEKIGRISGYGWSFGYVGGLVALCISYILFIQPDLPVNPLTGKLLDKSTGEHIRIINILIAVWFFIFSIPTFLFVNSKEKSKKINLSIIHESFGSLKKTFMEIRLYKETLKFLLARLVYNDALITVFAFGGIYAKEVFGFTFNEIFLFGIVLNVAAGLGAFLMGFLDDRVGGKKTIQVSNYGYILACMLAIFSPTINTINFVVNLGIDGKSIFWLSGVLIGIFSGPNQAASRSLMGRLTPKHKKNEFFGFYAFSGKATAFLGPLLFSSVVSFTGSLRYGLCVVLFLFACGIYLLSLVNENDGIKSAQNHTT